MTVKRQVGLRVRFSVDGARYWEANRRKDEPKGIVESLYGTREMGGNVIRTGT